VRKSSSGLAFPRCLESQVAPPSCSCASRSFRGRHFYLETYCSPFTSCTSVKLPDASLPISSSISLRLLFLLRGLASLRSNLERMQAIHGAVDLLAEVLTPIGFCVIADSKKGHAHTPSSELGRLLRDRRPSSPRSFLPTLSLWLIDGCSTILRRLARR
jgi:hypothetical protein